MAVVLGRLFANVDPDDYRIVAFGMRKDGGSNESLGLAAKTFRLDTRWQPPRDSSYVLSPVRTLRRYTVEVIRRGRSLAGVLTSERCSALMVVSGGSPNLAAGLLAARLARKPLIVYMFDDWRYQLPQTSLRILTRVLQRAVLAGSAAVLVPNEVLKEELDRVYGCACTVIPNPVAPGVIDDRPLSDVRWPSSPDTIRIVYTGQVYGAQLDSIARVLGALGSQRLARFALHIYAPQTEDYLRRAGLVGRMVVHPYLSTTDIRDVQRSAHILLLPLAFASPYPDIIRTAAPAKLGEYLASGRPILVHAPRDSFVSGFAKRERIAEIVDEPVPELLVDALERIATDAEHRSALAARARVVARREFSPRVASQRFLAALHQALA